MVEKKLDFTTPDSRGYVPNLGLLGTSWKHSGNDHVYFVQGFLWNGEDDTWMLMYNRVGSGIVFTRSPANFYGVRVSSLTNRAVNRFTKVE